MVEITNRTLENQTPILDARFTVFLNWHHMLYCLTQRGHDHEEEGKSNGSIQGITRRGNPKDYNVKLHGGTQGFEI